MYSNVVLEIHKDKFEDLLEDKKDELGIKNDPELTAEHLKEVVKEYKDLVQKHGKPFPQDTKEQLTGAIEAVFKAGTTAVPSIIAT